MGSRNNTVVVPLLRLALSVLVLALVFVVMPITEFPHFRAVLARKASAGDSRDEFFVVAINNNSTTCHRRHGSICMYVVCCMTN